MEAYEDITALFIVGGLLSVIGIIFLFTGIGVISALFGFFGGLICFLAWNPEDGVHCLYRPEKTLQLKNKS